MQNSESFNAKRKHSGDDSQDLNSILEDTDSGVSAEERDSILSQIDQMFDGSSAVKQTQDLNYQASKNGTLFPLLFSCTVLLLTGALIWGLFSIYNQREQSIITKGAAFSSAEGRVLREFREESEEQLSQREEEIENMRSDLSELEQEREQLAVKNQQILQQRSQELEAEGARRIEEERARLETSGISEEEINSRMERYEQQLAEQHREELAAVREEAQAALQEREEEISALSERFRRERQEIETGRQQVLQEFGSLQERQQEAQLFIQQISSAYINTVEAVENQDFEKAQRTIEVANELLSSESFRSLPQSDVRISADRAILSSLERLVDLEESRSTRRPPSGESEELQKLRRTVAQQREQLQEQEEHVQKIEARLASLSRTRDQLASTREELETLRRFERTIEKRTARLDSAANSLEEAASAPEKQAQRQDILEALDKKLAILEALTSEEVARQHPQLETTFEEYLDAFEQESQRKGYLAALENTIELIESTRENGVSREAAYFRREQAGIAETASDLVESLSTILER